MLNKEVFKQKIQEMIYFYPSWNIKNEESVVMALFYTKFSKWTDDQFIDVVNMHVDTIEFNPTIATLKRLFAVVEANKPSLDYSSLGEESSMWNEE